MKQMRAAYKARMQAAGAGAVSEQHGKPPEEGAKESKDKDAKKDEAKKAEEEAKLVKRPTEPTQPANPEELKVTPDATGRVQFNFRGQPWVDVLQWFADVAGYSLDWQELPGDFLNLTTHRKYTLAETRDLLNRHLLARGFTMVVRGEGLTVVKIDKLDPSLVPRGEADDLEDFSPYDFLRVTFPLPLSLDPAKAAADVKVLLSPNAKVTPLLASRRLLVIDAVANLRDVRDLLYAEQIASDRTIKPREFQLQYRRADYVADQIMVVLGINPETRSSPQELQLEQQKMQMMMKMQQKGKDVSQMLHKDAPPVHIAVDQRQNSLFVNAPPDLMRIIERTIELFDRPDGAGGSGEGLASSPGSLAPGPMTLEKYQTVTASPDKVIDSLQEIAHLNPTTQLQSDNASKTIYAYATATDHAKIRKIIDRLDGSGRHAEMRWLRRLPADQVAGTLMALLVGEVKKKEKSRRRSFYFGYERAREEEKPQVGFKALADVEHNRLLLWVTDSELEEVDKILKQLGEVPGGRNSHGSTLRVLRARDPQEAVRLLRRLENSWSGKSRLRIHVPPATPARPESPAKPVAPARKDDKPTAKKSRPPASAAGKDQVAELGSLRHGPPKHGRLGHGRLGHGPPGSAVGPVRERSWSVHFAMLSKLSGESNRSDPTPATRASGRATLAAAPVERTTPDETANNGAEHAETAPPIDVVVLPDGRILLRGEDSAALDELEDLLDELTPPQEKFTIFELHNARASLVVLNLEEYFEDELKGQKDAQYSIWGEYMGTKRHEQGPISLSKKPLLRFIYDVDTNTIVVQNASPEQLRTIGKLIEIYDRPLDEDSVMSRRTEAIKIHYSRAADIASAVKEVYRDLLSSKDKAFQGKDGQAKSRTETHYRFYGSAPPEGKKKPAAVKVAFEGALSIGVDELSNTLIISAQEDVWENVHQLVLRLDESAMPRTVVQVHEVLGMVSSTALQQSLSKALGNPWIGGKPQQAAAKGGKGKEGKSRNEGDKGKPARNKKPE